MLGNILKIEGQVTTTRKAIKMAKRNKTISLKYDGKGHEC